MAIVKYIDNIPAFSTKNEAVTWGRVNLGITGSHIHYDNGNKIYMPGTTHEAVLKAQRDLFLKLRKNNTL
tara:strand:+ start:206 stop:415 length:210 start_codon:yes stop_codon:yes gene_type:complete